MPDHIVITGMGFVTSLGNIEETFKALCEGRSGIAPIEGSDASGFSAGMRRG